MSDDYPTTVDKFHEMFGSYLTRLRPVGVNGINFMTSDVLGHILVNGEPVEISTGMFLDDRMFGVTFGHKNGQPDERSTSFDSLDAVRAYLMELTGFAADPLP